MPRPSKPTQLHKLTGTFRPDRQGKRRANEPEPTGDLALPDAPDFFTETQRAAWAYAVKHAPKGVMKRIDRGILALWCDAEDRWRTAVIQQAKMDQGNALPLLTKGAAGPISSPYLRIIRHASEQMLQCARELGFSPAARPRIRQELSPEDAAQGSTFDRLKVIHGGKAAG